MLKQQIKKLIEQAIQKAQQEKRLPKFDIPEIKVEYSQNEKFGDYSTNIAMQIIGLAKKNPMAITEVVCAKLRFATPEPKGSIPDSLFEKIEVAKPGFINFYLKPEWLARQVKTILKQKDKFGALKIGQGRKVQVEFISANPTGPLHIGNGRGGFMGDALTNVLSLAGYRVEREYLINNMGGQIRTLGHSVLKDEEAKYKGEYIDDLHKRLDSRFRGNDKKGSGNDRKAGLPAGKAGGNDPEEVGQWAADVIMREIIRPTIEKRMKIKFDVWFSERDLHKQDKIKKIIDWLKKKAVTYESEKALWFKSSSYGDSRDRVLIKADGAPTYLAVDFAYHQNKFKERKFNKVINIWGADHFGDVPGLLAAVEVLGYKGGLDILIVQHVRLLKDGKEIKMSKRTGTYITLDELIDEVGLDAARFFFLMYSADKHMDFDMDLARQQSEKNPVYYVQYAHARICSILRKLTKNPSTSSGNMEPQKLNHSAELALIKELIKWPEVVQEVAKSYEVHRLPFYAQELATKFHNFYDKCRVIDKDIVNQNRLELIQATKIVLADILKTMGISAPEKM